MFRKEFPTFGEAVKTSTDKIHFGWQELYPTHCAGMSTEEANKALCSDVPHRYDTICASATITWSLWSRRQS
jgi:hypothetical protein